MQNGIWWPWRAKVGKCKYRMYVDRKPKQFSQVIVVAHTLKGGLRLWKKVQVRG